MSILPIFVTLVQNTLYWKWKEFSDTWIEPIDNYFYWYAAGDTNQFK